MAATATKTKAAASKREERIKELQTTLAHEVEALRDPERWVEWLHYCAQFHKYSFGNQLLISAQFPGATLVAGYRGWQARGRQVRRGERGIWIWGGRSYRRTTTEEDSDDESASKATTGVYFFPVSVFGISQTDPIEGRDETPTHPLHGSLSGQDVRGIAATVRSLLAARGIPVIIEDLPGAVDGCTTSDPHTGQIKKVSISPRLSPAEQAVTALHELAHTELGHIGRSKEYHGAGRGLFEVEAESVAFIVANLMGLDSAPISAGYVAGWAKEADGAAIEAAAEHVAKTSHAIAEALQLTAQ